MLRTSRTVVALVAVVVSLVVPLSDASAHSDRAVLSLAEVAPTEDGSGVTVQVSMRFDSDDHEVIDATIRLSGSSSSGVTLMPLQLSDTDTPGLYGVTATLGEGTGLWSLRVTSDEPVAELTFDYDPADPGATPTGLSSLSDEVQREDRPPFVWIALGCTAVAAVAVVVRLRQRRSERKRPH